MNVDGSKVSLEKKKEYEIIDVRCDKKMIDALKDEKGFHEAYHMNKDRWITILLDGSAEREDITFLLDMSYRMTASGITKKTPYEKKCDPHTGNA